MQNCFITICILVFVVAACNNQQAENAGPVNDSSSTVTITPLENVFDKLLGTWQNTGDKSFERWTKNEDSSYHVVVFDVKGTDTTFKEDNKVYLDGGKWVSANKVSGQNDGKTIKFTESLITANSFQFSNPAHDFPTDIHYDIIDANTVNAYIVGPNSKGGKDTIPFNYTRVK